MKHESAFSFSRSWSFDRAGNSRRLRGRAELQASRRSSAGEFSLHRKSDHQFARRSAVVESVQRPDPAKSDRHRASRTTTTSSRPSRAWKQARNQAAAANAAFFPQAGYGGDIGRGRNALYNTPAALNGQPTVTSAQLNLNAAWEIDLWGRIRRSSEAARAQYLATDEARRGVMITLVSDVATRLFSIVAIRSGTGDSTRRDQCLRRQLPHLQRPVVQWRRLQTGNRPRRRRVGQCRRRHPAT